MRFLQCAKVSTGSNLPIRRLVFHCTVSPCVPGEAWNVARYFANPAARGSAHEVIDPVEAVGTARANQVAWHAPPNPYSYGFELCDPIGTGGPATELPASRWFDKNHTAMLTIAAARARVVAAEHSIPLRWLTVAEVRAGLKGLCTHDDVSRAFGQSDHWDTGRGFPKDHFLRMITGGVTPPPVPERREANMIYVAQKQRGVWLIGGKQGARWIGPQQWEQAMVYLVKPGLAPVISVPDVEAGPAAFDVLMSQFTDSPAQSPYEAPYEAGEDAGFYPEADVDEWGIDLDQYTQAQRAHLTALREVQTPGHDRGNLVDREYQPDEQG